MAQTGYTPILIYASGTASNVPSAGNLTNSANGAELALNYNDGKLYYKNASNVVTLLASAATVTPVVTFSGGTTGLTPSSPTSGAIALAGTLVPANGGTGTSGVPGNGQLLIGNGSTYSVASLTQGSNISVTNASGSITLASVPRVLSATTATSLTPLTTYDQYNFTALASGLTINAPTGSYVDGQKMMFRILDNGTARALTWNGTFTAIGVTLPTTTVASKMTYVGCIYNSANTRWDVIAVTTQV